MPAANRMSQCKRFWLQSIGNAQQSQELKAISQDQNGQQGCVWLQYYWCGGGEEIDHKVCLLIMSPATGHNKTPEIASIHTSHCLCPSVSIRANSHLSQTPFQTSQKIQTTDCQDEWETSVLPHAMQLTSWMETGTLSEFSRWLDLQNEKESSSIEPQVQYFAGHFILVPYVAIITSCDYR